MSLKIFHYNYKNFFKNDTTSSDMCWLYFGKDHAKYLAIKAVMVSHGQEICSGYHINSLARRYKSYFIQQSREALSECQTSAWLASAALENNPYTSDIFYHFLCVKYLEEQLSQNHKTIYVIVEDEWFCFWLKRHFDSQIEHEAKFMDPLHQLGWSMLDILRQLVLILGQGVFFFVYHVLFKILNRVVTSQEQSQAFWSDVSHVIVFWLDQKTWINGSLSPNEPYGKGLTESIRTTARKIGFVGIPLAKFFPLTHLKNLKRGKNEPLAILQDCLSIKDVIVTVKQIWARRWPQALKVRVDGLDVTDFYRREALVEKAHSSVYFRLSFAAIPKHIQSCQAKPVMMIMLFENHPWEKVLTQAAKAFLSQTQIAAYHHAPVPPLYLNMFTPQLEAYQCDYYFVFSHFFADRMQESGYDRQRLINIPSYRFMYLNELSRQAESKQQLDEFNILVAGSISYSETLELVVATLKALPGGDALKIHIKLHPKMHGFTRFEDTVYKMLNESMKRPNVDFIDTPIPEALPNTQLLVYNFTAVSYEAIFMGIPVLFVESQTWFDMNKLDWFDDLAFRARSLEQIKDCVTMVQSWSQDDLKEWRKRTQFLKDTFNFDTSYTTSWQTFLPQGQLRKQLS